MTSVLPVHLVLFRVFLRKSDKNQLRKTKALLLLEKQGFKVSGWRDSNSRPPAPKGGVFMGNPRRQDKMYICSYICFSGRDLWSIYSKQIQNKYIWGSTMGWFKPIVDNCQIKVLYTILTLVEILLKLL